MGVGCLHDSARPHIALPVRRFLAQHDVTEMQYLPYTPDLAAAYFIMYPKLKNSLKGIIFQDVEAIKKTVMRLLNSIPKEDFLPKSTQSNTALRLMGITPNHIK